MVMKHFACDVTNSLAKMTRIVQKSAHHDAKSYDFDFVPK